MALAPKKLKQVPDRLLAALHRAGMPEEAIRQAYGLEDGALSRALKRPVEPVQVGDLDFLPSDGWHYELWEGELVRMSPTKPRHGGSAGRLAKFLGAYLVQHPVGEIYVAEVGFRSGPGESVICPDVAYVSNEAAADEPLDEYYSFAPDIAAEIWSPDNTETEMRQKAASYLAHGSRLVWLLRPQDRTMRGHRPDGAVQVLQASDSLSGDDVLPGFSVPVSALFP